MKIMQYQINNQVFIKAEPTKLTPLPINNDSDNYYLVIPSIASELPSDVMFISETLLIAPHSTFNYYPKMVKLGISLQQSIATKITNGVTIKLIIIDNIEDKLAINETYTIKNNGTIARNNNKVTFEAPITDGQKIKADQETLGILNMIENRIAKNENIVDNKIIKKMVPITETTIEEIPNDIEEISDKKPIKKRTRTRTKSTDNVNKPKGRQRRKLPQSDVDEILMQD